MIRRLLFSYLLVIVIAFALMSLTINPAAAHSAEQTQGMPTPVVMDPVVSTNYTPMLWAAGLALALLLLGLVFARSVSMALQEVSRTAGRIGHGDYTARVRRRGRDEVANLTCSFNRMAESIESQEKFRRELVANVSHDLRTPLTVIRGYLEGLRSNQIADRRSAERAFEAMYGEVVRLQRMVNNLNQITYLDSATPGLQTHPVLLGGLVNETLERVRPMAEAKGVRLENRVPQNLPEITGDAEGLGQALFNLLENAIRHTPPEGIVTVSVESANRNLWIKVRDTGEGIAAEDLPHIFERFYRADRARNRAEGNAGLGLAIVRGVAEAHGGKAWAESEGAAGRGSVFTIQLNL